MRLIFAAVLAMAAAGCRPAAQPPPIKVKMPPALSAMATKLEPGTEAHVIDTWSSDPLPKIRLTTPDGPRDLVEGDKVRVLKDPGPEFADSADDARDRAVSVEVVQSLLVEPETKGEVTRKFIAIP